MRVCTAHGRSIVSYAELQCLLLYRSQTKPNNINTDSILVFHISLKKFP